MGSPGQCTGPWEVNCVRQDDASGKRRAAIFSRYKWIPKLRLEREKNDDEQLGSSCAFDSGGFLGCFFYIKIIQREIEYHFLGLVPKHTASKVAHVWGSTREAFTRKNMEILSTFFQRKKT
ncbi:hypothetical protein SETIT_9G055500v2 [Setaria italica]|uniref:Uncharacterized protein n=1 Tax=Setaria italica TaxID=4555 RepID=A0A368SDL8_SETIT|nr:hypothetical protein SETIT_9G055500v2 [Setaria italica]